MQPRLRRRRRQFKIMGVAIVLFVLTSFTSFFIFTKANKVQDIKPAVNIKQVDNVREEETISKVTLSFVGDILMHTAQRKSGYISQDNIYNFDGFFSDVKMFFADRDYIVGSFETPIIKEKSDNLYSGYPAFKSPPEFVSSVKNSGINVLMTANNHILDQGGKGVIETMKWIEEYGLPFTGTFKSLEDRQKKPVLFLEKNNIKLAFVNYTEITNMAPSSTSVVNYIELEKIKKDIEFAKASSADAVVVWLHFGNEYQRFPSEKQKDIVKSIAGYGADIIIGSHPHVIQPMEIINIEGHKTFVAYSLGNFVSNQYWRYSTDGMILNIDIEKSVDKVELKNINYIPTAVVREYKGPETQNEKTIKTSDQDSDFITGAISRGTLKGNEIKYRVVGAGQAIYDYENKKDENLTEKDYVRLKTTWDDTTGLIGETKDFKVYRDFKTERLQLGQ